MSSRFFLVALATVVTCALFTGREAGVAMTVPRVFSDHMVLQRGANTPFWGTGTPGERVTISLADRKITVAVDRNGHWKARLHNLPVGGPFKLVFSGKNTIAYSDVLVGDVWLSAGQSNMGYLMCQDAVNDAATASLPDDPLLRLYSRHNNVPYGAPTYDPEALWSSTAPASFEPPCNSWHGFPQGRFRTWPAVAYYFAREIRARTGVPVGIVNLAAGGTDIENWVCKDTLATLPEVLANFNRPISEPGMRPYLRWDGVVAPVVGFGIRGALWYQGENNAWGHASLYERTLALLVRDWRQRWGQEVPFFIVQLTNIRTANRDIHFQVVREAQLHVSQTVPNTALIVTVDTGDGDLHPPNKIDIGHRLALAARAISYHESVSYSGPTFKDYAISGNTIVIRFAHAEGLTTKNGSLKYIEIAGKDRAFVPADARIVGEQMVVSSPGVSEPVAVRYAWMNDPLGANLYNGAGLPASPFRTDSWPE